MRHPKWLNVLLAGDFHSGCMTGLLTPPDQHIPTGHPLAARYKKVQRECWNVYAREIDDIVSTYGKIDVALWNGDLIDGRQERAEGTNLVIPDRYYQACAAAQVIKYANARKNYLTTGTPYHVGKGEQWETVIGDMVKAEAVEDDLWLDVGGITIHARHFIGNSQIPHGRGTALLRDMLWLGLKAQQEEWPKADLVVRSHVHWCIGVRNGNVGLTLPALQAAGGRFGKQIMSGIVHFGVVFLRIPRGEPMRWRAECPYQVRTVQVKSQRPEVLKTA